MDKYIELEMKATDLLTINMDNIVAERKAELKDVDIAEKVYEIISEWFSEALALTEQESVVIELESMEDSDELWYDNVRDDMIEDIMETNMEDYITDFVTKYGESDGVNLMVYADNNHFTNVFDILNVGLTKRGLFVTLSTKNDDKQYTFSIFEAFETIDDFHKYFKRK